MSRRRRFLLLVGAVVLLASCGGISRSELDEEIQARGGGLGSALPEEALDALRDELGDDLVLRSLTATVGQVSVEVLVPGTDDQIDTYGYGTSGLYGGGGLSEPTPVPSVGAVEDLRRSLFRAERLDLEALDDLVDDAIDTADIEGGYAQTLRVDRPAGTRVVITVNVKSDRQNAQVRYLGDGTPIRDGQG